MTFTYQGRELELFDHPYNATLTNERAVEIPIALDFMERAEGDAGLEVGNVLHHYADLAVDDWALQRRIVDKYERGELVDNIDVFAIEGEYDWIVSVSTLEHIRRDPPEPSNPYGAVAALAYLRGLLRDGGRMLVTVGLGQNPVLDDLLLDVDSIESAFGQAFDVSRATVLGRMRGDTPEQNAWVRHVGPLLERQASYGPTHGANAVWIGEWQA